jgi:hypothetical protein
MARPAWRSNAVVAYHVAPEIAPKIAIFRTSGTATGVRSPAMPRLARTASFWAVTTAIAEDTTLDVVVTVAAVAAATA